MAGLCEGGNEPLGSLKANHVTNNALAAVEEFRRCFPNGSVSSCVFTRVYRMLFETVGNEAGCCGDAHLEVTATRRRPDKTNIEVAREEERKETGGIRSDSSAGSYPAFVLNGLRESPGKNLNQVTCLNQDINRAR
ncbi:hypothetical protein ANN_00431 [Periplaneta americana]|uniref:Uncharacterized protein n=1 Tax=Periplaneta americana TaxID=6978 RepID=A0ABQ8TQX2_PERAM|nr:hypothetical protein ANN_00431 [Periplaneta americana]